MGHINYKKTLNISHGLAKRCVGIRDPKTCAIMPFVDVLVVVLPPSLLGATVDLLPAFVVDANLLHSHLH